MKIDLHPFISDKVHGPTLTWNESDLLPAIQTKSTVWLHKDWVVGMGII